MIATNSESRSLPSLRPEAQGTIWLTTSLVRTTKDVSYRQLAVKHLVKGILQQAGVTKHKHFLLLPPLHRAAWCVLATVETAPEQQLSSTNVLGKPVVAEAYFQIAWQIQLISFLKTPFPATAVPTCSSSPTYSVRHVFPPVTGLDSVPVKHVKRAEQKKRGAVT